MIKTTGGAAAVQRTVWKGWVEMDGKKMYLKSKWEKNYCLYLNFLKGQRMIKDFWYEPETFWFKGIKRGTNNYKPDFVVLHNNDCREHIEVKGWMDDKSKTKIKRMAKYHPNITLRIVGKEFFKKNKHLKPLLKWE